MNISENKTRLGLSHLAENPELLIPQHLRDISPNPNALKAANFDVWIGRMDNEYQPALSTIIFSKDSFAEPTHTQEDDHSNWGRALNYQRIRSIRQGLMTENDEALLSIIAADRAKNGVFIEAYIDAERLRGHGVGKAFFPHLNKLLQEMGCRYLWGINNEDNIGFFRRFGNYTLDQLDNNKVRKNPQIFPDTTKLKVTTIHFFDTQMEDEFVKPEYLKNPAASKTLIPTTAQGE